MTITALLATAVDRASASTYRAVFARMSTEARSPCVVTAASGEHRGHYAAGDLRTILAETGGAVVGLAHTILGEHPAWGALLDNLHVAHGLKRQGIGSRLLALTGQEVVDWSPSSGLYLWVLEQNSDARAFYAARGGACVERAEIPPPGGDRARLNGKPMG
jgi:GNAT superfamily N-acetyltransferase